MRREGCRQPRQECLQIVVIGGVGHILEIDGDALQLVGGDKVHNIVRPAFARRAGIGQQLGQPRPIQFADWMAFCSMGRIATSGLRVRI